MAEAARVRRETVAAAESAVEAAASATVKAAASTARSCERQSAGGQQ
jgi:hypothetical protein